MSLTATTAEHPSGATTPEGSGRRERIVSNEFYSLLPTCSQAARPGDRGLERPTLTHTAARRTRVCTPPVDGGHVSVPVPVFLAVEVEGADGSAARPDRQVRLFFQAPAVAPTTRGFAGILHAGLDGLTVEEVLAVPDDAPFRFGLGEAVSPLRLRGMVAILSRIKRQIRPLVAA